HPEPHARRLHAREREHGLPGGGRRLGAVWAARRRDQPRGRDVPGELHLFPLLWGWTARQQVFRERDVRLDRNPLLPAAQKGLCGRPPGLAGTRREGGRGSAPSGTGVPARASPRMNLQPGCRFIMAPHFHLAADWSRRLLVGAGVEEVNGCFFPLHSWRPPTNDQLVLLPPPSGKPTPPEGLAASLFLVQLPRPLASG